MFDVHKRLRLVKEGSKSVPSVSRRSYSTKFYMGKRRLEALLPFHKTFWPKKYWFWQSLPIGLRACWNGWMVKQWPQNVYNKLKLHFPICPLAPAAGGNGWSSNHDRVLPRILWWDMNMNVYSAEDISWFGKNFLEIPDFSFSEKRTIQFKS